MPSRIMYEQQLIDEVRGLSIQEMGRLLKLVHLVREEFMPSKSAAVQSVADFAGCLKDLSDADLSLFDDATRRCNLFTEREPLA